MTPPRHERRDARVRRHAAVRVMASFVLAATVGLGRLALGPLDAQPAFASTAPLPACRYDDILTSPRGYGDWATTLVDTILSVPKTYVPPDLTLASAAGIGGYGYVRSLVIPDLGQLAAAAKAAGAPLAVLSAFRSYETQQTVYRNAVNKDGVTTARLYSARPGHSEHQLGLAIDFKSAGGGSPFDGDWGLSPAGSWLRTHGWEYGFIQSYPKGKRSVTCYAYESWHFRYVGRAEAAAVHASRLTLREYLWANFTTVAVPGASGAPHPSAMPSAQPSVPSPVPSFSDGASSEASPATTAGASPDGATSPGASDEGGGTGGTGGTGSPEPSGGLLVPAVTWFGLDPSVVAAIALVAVVAALMITLGIGRVGSRRRGPGMARKSRDGP